MKLTRKEKMLVSGFDLKNALLGAMEEKGWIERGRRKDRPRRSEWKNGGKERFYDLLDCTIANLNRSAKHAALIEKYLGKRGSP